MTEQRSIEGLAYREEPTSSWAALKTNLYNTIHLGPRASMAAELIAQWGAVAGKENGEDSAGRAKIGLQTPEEVVSRACEMADIAFNQFRERGWLLDVPVPEIGDGG